MGKKKKGFIVYNNQLEPMEDLTMEQRGILFTALFKYHDNGDIIETNDAAVRMAFKFFKKDIDIDAEKYKKTCEKNAENARLRWDAKSSDRIQADAMDADIDTDIDIEIVKDKGTDKIPSSQEVESFAVEYSNKHKKDKQQCIDLAIKGWNNYKNADWKDVKGNKVKNWKIKLSNSYLSLDKLKDAVDESQSSHDKSLTWLTQGNRNFEDLDYCLMAYNSGEARPTESKHLENVLKYKKLI